MYRKLADTIGALEMASRPADIWTHVKSFAAEFNCHHVVALDNGRLPNGISNALLYSDATPAFYEVIDREKLHLGHPLETYARENHLPFLVSDVRRDQRFREMRWRDTLSDPVLHGDAVVTPIRDQERLSGTAFFGGREIKDSPVARSSLMVVAHAAFNRIAALMESGPSVVTVGLSAREVDCLQLLARGHEDQATASRLGISRRTVRFHIDHAKRKLGVSSRVHAVAAAIGRGLITL
jgi:DNA-binding CsgD family transcriptional regulator